MVNVLGVGWLGVDINYYWDVNMLISYKSLVGH